MNKQEIYALLSTRNIWHEVTEHKAVYNMAEVAEIHLPYPEADAKNLFIRDDKKRKLLMLSPVEEELAQVRDLFDHFLRLGSVTKLLQYCLEHRIVSRNGND